VHVVGCDRRCGSPSGAHVEVLAAGDRVVVRGVAADGSEHALAAANSITAFDAAAAALRVDLNAAEAGER
jgi:chorismate-pyruvate lyase